MQQLTEYKRTEVNTSDNVRIISMLYDGAINFIRVAKRKMEQNDTAGKGLYLVKATAIVAELSSSLNMEAGGEIAGNLRRLYNYVLDRLLYANMKNDPKAFDDAEKILDVLRGAWQEIGRTRAVAANIPMPKVATNRVAMEMRV